MMHKEERVPTKEEQEDIEDSLLPLHLVRGTKVPTPPGTWIKLWRKLHKAPKEFK